MPIVDPNVLSQLPVRPSIDRTRGAAELFRRAGYMPPQRRAVVEGILKHGLTMRQIGDMVGSPPGTISRRFKRYLQILNDPIVIALTDPRCSLDGPLHDLAVAHLLGGKSLTRLALEHDTTPGQIKQRLAAARGWLLRERAEQRTAQTRRR